jgi:hypothetical protein
VEGTRHRESLHATRSHRGHEEPQSNLGRSGYDDVGPELAKRFDAPARSKGHNLPPALGSRDSLVFCVAEAESSSSGYSHIQSSTARQ